MTGKRRFLAQNALLRSMNIDGNVTASMKRIAHLRRLHWLGCPMRLHARVYVRILNSSRKVYLNCQFGKVPPDWHSQLNARCRCIPVLSHEFFSFHNICCRSRLRCVCHRVFAFLLAFDRWKIKPSETCVVASVRAIILEIRKHDVKHDELEAPTPKWH